ncbi:MAG TPA: hypothetical protein VFJ76_01200 [Solirubrobacterales bacterium]|nr:hypothetical protein [Solirubrobacterales bacterium]
MGKRERLSAERAEREQRREAEKQAREEQEAALTRERRGRLTGTLASLAAMAIFLVGGIFVLTHSWHERERVTGRLAGVNELSYTPAVQDSGGISPVCGCLKPPFNAWRGITFAGREAVVSRRGRSPMTEWTLSGAQAKEGIEPAPAQQRMAVEVVQMDPRDPFDPSWMVNGKLGEHGKVLSRSAFNSYMLSIINNGNLHVGLLGDVPVGAWIPLPRSEVELTAEPSPFPGTPSVPRMTEKHPPGRSMDEVRFEQGRVRGQGYPLGDFLGPNLVLWSTAPMTEVSGLPIEKEQGDKGLVTAVRLKGSTFSTRIAAVPVSRKELNEQLPYMFSAPHGGREYLFSGRPDGSEVVLRVTRPLGRQAYAQLRRRVLAHPVVHMRPVNLIRVIFPKDEARPGARLLAPIDLKSRLLNGARRRLEARRKIIRKVVPIPERDRYPPLPREAGFNIFGPLHSILFRGVHGDLLLADKPKSLSASADLRLTDVSALRNEAGEEFVPAPLSTSGDSAALQFRTVGAVSINEVPQSVTNFMDEHQKILAAISFLFGVLSAILGIYAFIRERTRQGQ